MENVDVNVVGSDGDEVVDPDVVDMEIGPGLPEGEPLGSEPVRLFEEGEDPDLEGVAALAARVRHRVEWVMDTCENGIGLAHSVGTEALRRVELCENALGTSGDLA